MRSGVLGVLLGIALLLPAESALATYRNGNVNWARRDTAAAKPGTRTLYLIRHGEYDHLDSADARVGKHLTKLGRQQAALVAKRLGGLPVPIAEVRTSMLSRAMETGDIIGAALHVPVSRDSLFNECTPPASRTDIRYDTPGEADSSQTQLEAAWAAYATPSPAGDVHEVVAAHGNVIRWFVMKALGAETKPWANMDIAHCGVTIVTIKPDGTVRLVTFNEVGHLPIAKQTWAGKGPGWVR